MTRESSLYRCPQCKKEMARASVKQWIPSYCEKAGRVVRIQRIGEDKP